MISFLAAEHNQHQPAYEFWNSRPEPSVEVPARVEAILQGLEKAGLEAPSPVHETDLAPLVPALERIHTHSYLDYLQSAYARWTAAGGDPAGVMPFVYAGRRMAGKPEHGLARPGLYAFDMGALIVKGTAPAANGAAWTAKRAAEALARLAPVVSQTGVYALCRPPGHHAGSDFYGGYCYLNNAALAADVLRTVNSGDQFPRVALLDIDVHHGNGSQDIFYKRSDVLVVSLHMDPAVEYPFFAGYQNERGLQSGEGYNINYPLPLGTGDEAYRVAMHDALDQIARFGASACVVSLGVDTFGGDPIGKFNLSRDIYPKIGGWIAKLGCPTLFVQEGGYNLTHIGELVASVLAGFEQKIP